MRKPFKIIFVCTGNICRSPFGERVLAAALDQISPGEFEVTSAGTYGMIGYPFAPESAVLAQQYGANVENFEPRRLTEQMIRDNDLLLALTQEHRQKIISLDPSALRKTFTLRDFAHSINSLEPDTQAASTYEAWQDLVAQAFKRRHQIVTTASESDVIDPWQQGNAAYQQMADEMIPCLSVIVNKEKEIKNQNSF
ncbi:MAG: low molecular weight phosphatase family protein [Micrococcaceae bacterium]